MAKTTTHARNRATPARRAGLLAVSALALTLAPPAQAASAFAPAYTLTPASTPSLNNITLVALNNAGTAVGSSGFTANAVPVIWQNGQLQVMTGFTENNAAFFPFAINNHGLVLGSYAFGVINHTPYNYTVEHVGSFNGLAINAVGFVDGQVSASSLPTRTSWPTGLYAFDDTSQLVLSSCFALGCFGIGIDTQTTLSFASTPPATALQLYPNKIGVIPGGPASSGQLYLGIVGGHPFGGSVSTCAGNLCGTVFSGNGTAITKTDLAKKFGAVSIPPAAHMGNLLFNGHGHFGGTGWLLANKKLTAWSVPGQFFTAYAINVNDHIAGVSTDLSGAQHAFVWSPSGLVQFGTWPAATPVAVNGINAAGAVLLVISGSPSVGGNTSFVANCTGAGC